MLDPGTVLPLLRGRFGRPYVFVDACASTQDLLRDPGLPEGAVAVADHQTGGRGRQGRVWEDAPGHSLLASVLLRPEASPDVAQLALVVGHATAAAVADASGRETALKWPNDVLLDGGKVAGVLLEARDGAVTCGVGVNVNQPRELLPSGTSPPATSLLAACGRHHDRAALLADLLARLEDAYDGWRRDGLRPLLPDLEGRNWLRGRRVTAGGDAGVAGCLAPDGRLEVTLEGGGARLVGSGEVELR